ncbi:MAG: ATP-binding protein [Bacteroidota bacterium]
MDKSAQSEFVAVYGRRRVGKTMLIRYHYRNQIAFQLTALAHTSTTENQLLNFHLTLDELVENQKEVAPPKNWLYAFHRLKSYLSGLSSEKKVIFIDELPWLDTDDSDFIQALEHFWNSWASARDDIILVVCGSAASWMINNLINNHGGFYQLIDFYTLFYLRFIEPSNPQIHEVTNLYIIDAVRIFACFFFSRGPKNCRESNGENK